MTDLDYGLLFDPSPKGPVQFKGSLATWENLAQGAERSKPDTILGVPYVVSKAIPDGVVAVKHSDGMTTLVFLNDGAPIDVPKPEVE